eukprot:5006125-Prymnesium_polylepis.1
MLPTSSRCGAVRVERGYSIFDGWRANASVGTLGIVQGDDAHCRKVCDLVGGCNTITRAGRACLLSADCPQSPQPATCEAGAVTMVQQPCRLKNRWVSLNYPIPAKREGAHIAVITLPTTEACEWKCEVTPSCNSFRYKVRHFKKPYPRTAVECHLKMGCIRGNDKDVFLDPKAGAAFAKVHLRSPTTSRAVRHPLPNRTSPQAARHTPGAKQHPSHHRQTTSRDSSSRTSSLSAPTRC